MVLREVHKDIERYLNEDCYCIGEIYDVSGFFCVVYSPDDSCKMLVKGDQAISVLCKDQILVFDIENNRISDAIRMSATKHNIKQAIDYSNGTINQMNIDDSAETDDIDQILKYVDAIMQ